MSATTRNAVRNKADFYSTPNGAIYSIAPALSKVLNYWEPACGDSRIIQALNLLGFRCEGNDLTYGYDWLKETRSFKNGYGIITNPPFSLAQEFIDKVFELEACECFFLLRLSFLGSQYRKPWWQHNEPNALFILSERPKFTKKGTDNCEYAWFYWGDRYNGIFHV